MNGYVKTLCVSAGLAMLSACATTKDTFEADDLPTMKEIYDEQFERKQDEREGSQNKPGPVALENAQSAVPSSRRDPGKRDVADVPDTLPLSLRKLHRQFVTLPNPTMLMYIPAHLTSAGTPVPGYTTYFTLYERDHVALPSERRSPK